MYSLRKAEQESFEFDWLASLKCDFWAYEKAFHRRKHSFRWLKINLTIMRQNSIKNFSLISFLLFFCFCRFYFGEMQFAASTSGGYAFTEHSPKYQSFITSFSFHSFVLWLYDLFSVSPNINNNRIRIQITWESTRLTVKQFKARIYCSVGVCVCVCAKMKKKNLAIRWP